jgi:hypothetical protein
MKTNRFCHFIWLVLFIGIAGNLKALAQERQMGGAGITLFTDQNFRGKSVTYRQDVPDLGPLGFNDDFSSLRVGPGEQWEVCEHANYQGRCVIVSGSESDLRRNSWDDTISSLRRVGGGYVPGPPTGVDVYIVLFDQENYRGRPTNYNGPVSNLSRRVQSVTIGRGVWELCDDTNFNGSCITLDRSVPDLRSYNMRNRVASVRPISGDTTGPFPPTNDWYVVLFEEPTYRGNPTNYSDEESNLDKRTRSVTIGRGVWELCDGRNFSGRCVRLSNSVPDLRSYNFGNRVRSLRPIRRQPR